MYYIIYIYYNIYKFNITINYLFTSPIRDIPQKSTKSNVKSE